MEINWLNLMNLSKRILISTEIVYHMKTKMNLSENLSEKNELIREKSSEFHNLGKKLTLII